MGILIIALSSGAMAVDGVVGSGNWFLSATLLRTAAFPLRRAI